MEYSSSMSSLSGSTEYPRTRRLLVFWCSAGSDVRLCPKSTLVGVDGDVRVLELSANKDIVKNTVKEIEGIPTTYMAGNLLPYRAGLVILMEKNMTQAGTV